MKPYPIQARRSVQILFLLAVVFIGAKFYLFVSCIEKGVTPDFERPAGVEAFLPISALVSLKHLLYTGTINRIHPSGLVLFLMICFTAVFAKKGFCSWVCPVGTLSDKWQNEIPIQAYLDYTVSMNQELRSIDRIDGIDPEKKQKMILIRSFQNP